MWAAKPADSQGAGMIARIVASLAGTWNPSGELSPRMRLEMRILIGRWLGILFVGGALAVHPSAGVPREIAFGILVVALGYTFLLRKLIKTGHTSVEDGSLPATGDVLLCAAMLPMLGGFVFPFYAILYLVALSAGIRLGLWRGMLLAVSIAVLDALTSLSKEGAVLDSGYIIRSGVLLAIIPITSFLHDESQQNEADLAERLQQAEVLNQTLQHQATHDQLTGLANRAHLLEHVKAAMNAASDGHALLVIGIDRLNEVNDTLGHECGDRLLQQIAQRLRAAVHESDGDSVARVGGEQFGVLLRHADRLAAERAAHQVLTALASTFTVANCTIAVGASVGAALSPEHGTQADLLLRRADIAMSVARRRVAGFAFYLPEQDQHSAERLALVPELRRAIDNDELALWYQPKLCLASGRCVGLEALVRWNHPERGIVPPDQFILVAEQTGIIRHLTDWVLNAALKQQRAWQDQGLRLPVAVNLSMHDLQNPRLLDRVAELLERWQVPSRDLHIELTESSLMVDPVRALEAVSGLRTLGAVVAIDDFGTGYSSLGYLKRLPVDELKIDKSFVQDLDADEDDLAIVRSTIRLGHELGLHVTAEGVENAQAFSLLRDLGCDVAQGYYIGRPKPPLEVMRERQRVAA
jgi:diguanylate cyclase (GGDEF)-like protein